ncbi:MAG: hypothetical protein K0U37_00055, partial [Gammaproteobacteria bacterium]|nr:hypothetical protein [Gammaproteobacteria bacterium]
MNYKLTIRDYLTIAAAVSSIPKDATSIDLSENLLYSMPQKNLIVIMSAIPPGVTSINLSRTVLHSMLQEKFIAMMSAIPPGVT